VGSAACRTRRTVWSAKNILVTGVAAAVAAGVAGAIGGSAPQTMPAKDATGVTTGIGSIQKAVPNKRLGGSASTPSAYTINLAFPGEQGTPGQLTFRVQLNS
jgi:hypothetical protein